MRRLPALAISCSIVSRSFQLFVRAGVVAVLLAAVVAVAAGSASAQETPVEETFVIARVFACPTADTDLGSCESLAGVTLSIVLDGVDLAGGPLVTAMNSIGSNSVEFLASTSQWLSIAAIDGLPAGYVPAAGSDPFMALVSDLPSKGCGGESLCPYADLVVVPAGDDEPAPLDPPDAPEPQPDAGTTTVTIYSVLCPVGTTVGDLFETCYDSPAAGMPYRAGRPNTEFSETTTSTGDAGFVSFAVGGDTARVIQELPFAATIAVYCTADGAETGVVIVDSGNPALGVADVTLTGGDIRCDWYTIPVAGADAPQPADPVTAPAEDAEDVAVTALPNTGSGTAGSAAGIGGVVWLLVVAGFCAAMARGKG